MNDKENILKAWITIEQLSEGSINLKDKTLRRVYQDVDDWPTFFTMFLEEQKQKQTKRKLKDYGMVMYFNIFNFQEVINVLRSNYQIPATFEETSSSDKFSFCLYFDRELNFLPDQLFLTMSGYIRKTQRLPKDFLKIEEQFRNELVEQFEHKGFHATITELIHRDKATYEQFRYRFIENLEQGDANLHSFFIDDLEKAKDIETANLNRYFSGYDGQRHNLEVDHNAPHFNPSTFEAILQPKNYPLGRFPSNTAHALSLMQQVSVNLALNDENQIRSVNGPPGTGKTTLLKDIFAEMVVEQAMAICDLKEKRIKGSLVYWEKAKLAVLPDSISKHSIVVASSNNGAVQNIVNDLPKCKEIDETLLPSLEEADYFVELSNSILSVEFSKNKEGKRKRSIKSEPLPKENWGVFSLEGGAAANVRQLVLTVEFMERDLKEVYEPSTDVYREFLKHYDELQALRNEKQTMHNQMLELLKLKVAYDQKKAAFTKEEAAKKAQLARAEEDALHLADQLNQQQGKLQHDLRNAMHILLNLEENQADEKRNYEVLREQKPNFFALQKLVNRSKVDQYIEDLNAANEKLNENSELIKKFTHIVKELERDIERNSEQLGVTHNQLEQQKTAYSNWKVHNQKALQKISEKIQRYEKQHEESKIQPLDLTQSYDELQLSNPWFDEAFRVLQSELFIMALKVRKQFLYENKKQLKVARDIWSRQAEYSAKSNGEQLLLAAWQWINLAIPIVSTTFASFGRMFQYLNENTISNLFIDEAGQALPQASVGAIFRSKNVMVVGDPSQIKPVMTLDSNLLQLIGTYYQVNETFVSAEASTQSLVDRTSAYGYQKNEDEWIGIPLWVHRRSCYPMFTISNEISYDGKMVQGINKKDACGLSKWYDVSGKAVDKFVKEQSLFLQEVISKRLEKDPDLKDNIYVITPFNHVAFKLSQALDQIQFTKREAGKVVNIGTVHTFQGKEADVVYFVLGADTTSKGAAQWAVTEPNMMNVAATRAKKEFYVIGDKKLYASLGSEVANTTIEIVDQYNRPES